MERQDRIQDHQRSPIRQDVEQQRGLDRSQSRRQLLTYHLGPHGSNNIVDRQALRYQQGPQINNTNMNRQVPQQINPFLIQLEQPNPNNTTVYNQQPAQYRIINPNHLQVNLIQSQPILSANQLSQHHTNTTTKQISYDKIIIYGIVWLKQVNGLFDYQQKDKNEKTTIVIQDDVKGCINFIDCMEDVMLPKENDTYLLMFKKKDKTIHYERNQLKDINMASLKNQQNSEIINVCTIFQPKDPQFLCALKLIMNKITNQFTIKLFSYYELNNQFNIAKKSKLIEGIHNLSLSISDTQQDIHHHHPKTSPYFIVRTLNKIQPLGKKLYPGDLIKLGKIQFKVLSIDGASVQDKNCQEDRKALQVTQIDQQLQKDIECKYCLGGKSQEEDNFFLHLCHCKGHIGYVHYKCLTTWTKTKASIETSQNVKMYLLEKMKCEVCTMEFPKYFKYNGKVFHLLHIDMPEKHMVLVDVSQRLNSIIAVLSGDSDKPVLIGRGRAASLRVTDITVSRQHASIQRINDQYFVKDCKSKFGTLIRSSEKEIQQGIEHKKGFQINNVIFTIQVLTKQIQTKQQQQQIRQTVQQHQNIEKQGENQQNQQKVQNQEQGEQQQSRKNTKKWQTKNYNGNLQFQREQDVQDIQNYQKNTQNIVEQEMQENTRATKKASIKKQVTKTNNVQTTERSVQTSAFRRNLVSRSRSRVHNIDNPESNKPSTMQAQERIKRNEAKKRDISK